MRQQQTLWTCDRCGANVIGPPGTRKQPDGWRDVEVTVPSEANPLPVVAANVCGQCAAHLAEWWQQGKENQR